MTQLEAYRTIGSNCQTNVEQVLIALCDEVEALQPYRDLTAVLWSLSKPLRDALFATEAPTPEQRHQAQVWGVVEELLRSLPRPETDEAGEPAEPDPADLLTNLMRAMGVPGRLG